MKAQGDHYRIVQGDHDKIVLTNPPVYTQVDQDGWWQVVPQGPHHHHDLAGDVISPPLHGVPPGSLQWEGDEADYGVSNGQVEY